MTSDFWDEIHDAVGKDFIRLFAGEKLGTGSARSVYAFRFDSKYVLKIEEPSGSFQNVKEWEIWNEVKENKELKKWFAPCLSISPCGMVLLQRRVMPAYPRDYPKKIPKPFGDLKHQNYGMMEGRFVCCDYGTFISSNGVSSGWKKAAWWNEEDFMEP